MGLLGKYAAYRWMTGGGGGGGAGGPLMGVMAALMIAFLIMWAVFSVLMGIYNAIRWVILLAPHLFTVLLGVGLAFLYTGLVSPHSKEELRSAIENDASTMVAAALVLLVSLTILFHHNVAGIDENPGTVLSVVLAGIGLGWIYAIYKIDRLVGALPNGRRYRLGVLFPLGAGLVVDVFNVPIYTPSIWIVSLENLAFLSPLVVGLWLFSNRYEPGAGTSGGARNDSVPSTDD